MMRAIYVVCLLLSLLGPFMLYMQLQHGGEHHAMVPPALPAIEQHIDHDYLQQIISQNLWDKGRGSAVDGDKGAGLKGQLQNMQWQLLAVSTGGVESIAVVRAAGKVLDIKQGKLLPDASVLLQVLDEGVVIERAGIVHNVYLFGRQKEDTQ